jgi:hypothetical protein
MVRDANLIVIASEDRYAVKQYFEFFHSTRVQFRVLETEEGKSSPQHVMERLDAYIEEYDIGEGDQLWLVSDTDHWIEPGHVQNLVEVVRLWRQKQIGVALSNPCFDLRLLLHFAEFPNQASLKCDEIGERIRAAVGQYNKSRVYNLPIDNERVANAIQRSQANQPSSGEIPNQTGTSVHMIVQDLVGRGLICIPE